MFLFSLIQNCVDSRNRNHRKVQHVARGMRKRRKKKRKEERKEENPRRRKTEMKKVGSQKKKMHKLMGN